MWLGGGRKGAAGGGGGEAYGFVRLVGSKGLEGGE